MQRNKMTIFRRISQLTVVGLIAFAGIRHQAAGGGPDGSGPVDSYCPFGGIETLFYYFKTGEFLQKTNSSNLVLLLAVLGVTILAGSIFCSWICPFGAVQEGLGKLGKRIFGRTFCLPDKVHRPMRYLRYLSLLAILYFTVQSSSLAFEEYDPFKALFHFAFETTTPVVVLAVTIIASLLVESLWCKYLCPLGAVISIFGRFNLVSIKRDKDLCIECGLCNRACPGSISVDRQTTIVAGDCTNCFNCIEACPRPYALTVHLGGDK